MIMDGVAVEDEGPWAESPAERRRGPRATCPDAVASHRTVQDFCFGDDLPRRRHDHHVDIAGGLAAAAYVTGIEESDGVKFPVGRRACQAGPTDDPIVITSR